MRKVRPPEKTIDESSILLDFILFLTLISLIKGYSPIRVNFCFRLVNNEKGYFNLYLRCITLIYGKGGNS